MASALIIHNGFCGGVATNRNNCQDRLLVGLVFLTADGIELPSTNRVDIFQETPWELGDFFNQIPLPHERSRSWVFQHTEAPQPGVRLNNSFFYWASPEHHTVDMNGRTVDLRCFALKYSRRHTHVDGQQCPCDLDFNVQRASEWRLFHYEFRQASLFCLCYQFGGPSSPPDRRKSTKEAYRKRREDERDKDDPPSKRRLLEKSSSVSAADAANKDDALTTLCLAFHPAVQSMGWEKTQRYADIMQKVEEALGKDSDGAKKGTDPEYNKLIVDCRQLSVDIKNEFFHETDSTLVDLEGLLHPAALTTKGQRMWELLSPQRLS